MSQRISASICFSDFPSLNWEFAACRPCVYFLFSSVILLKSPNFTAYSNILYIIFVANSFLFKKNILALSIFFVYSSFMKNWYEAKYNFLIQRPKLVTFVYRSYRCTLYFFYICFVASCIYVWFFQRENFLKFVSVPAIGLVIESILRHLIHAKRPYEVMGLSTSWKQNINK